MRYPEPALPRAEGCGATGVRALPARMRGGDV